MHLARKIHTQSFYAFVCVYIHRLYDPLEVGTYALACTHAPFYMYQASHRKNLHLWGYKERQTKRLSA